MQSTKTAKLVKMIQEFYPEFPDGYWEIRRVRAGYIQRSAGAFSFFLEWNGPRNEEALRFSIGSSYPVWYILKHGIGSITSRYGDLHIYPKE